MKPERFCKASGNIIRKILQQLEKAGFVKQEQRGKHKGRATTEKGKSFLDKVAAQIVKGNVKKEVKKEEKATTTDKLVKETKKKFEKKEDKKEKNPTVPQPEKKSE
jgi:DNA-binding PadR family transcriptional regulator